MIDGVVAFPAEFAARYRESGYWQDRPLRDVLGAALHEYVERIALIDGDKRVTYRQLDEGSGRLARHLADRGIGVGASTTSAWSAGSPRTRTGRSSPSRWNSWKSCSYENRRPPNACSPRSRSTPTTRPFCCCPAERPAFPS
ncbi:hypothetical protein GCM10022233_69350 [Streptomyces shaanxiensis]|uniref:AMP-dependent synthetase/ligase domain-containing protein n=1 Tax=Streptomyces shaanxiensis TaxID=653357 RepID=A0ABP7W4P3_9ACTN